MQPPEARPVYLVDSPGFGDGEHLHRNWQEVSGEVVVGLGLFHARVMNMNSKML